MLVELHIKLKARHRADGLFEIRPTINGVKRSIYGHTAEEISKKYHAAIKAAKKDVVRKQHPIGAIFLFDWWETWLSVYKKPNVAKSTLDNLSNTIRKHLKPYLENKPLARYTMTDLMLALNNIESTRMRKYARGILQASFADAVVAGNLTVSPAQNLPQVKHRTQKGKAFALNDLIEMFSAAPKSLSRNALLYFLFCFFSGTRRDEALNVRPEDCDFVNKVILIRGTKTETSKRRIPMFPILEKLLQLSMAIPPDVRSQFPDRVFKVAQYRIDDEFRAFRGSKPGVQHWLRHTFGTIQICILSMPMNTVALWMGHSDPSTTIDIYTHPEDLAPDIYFSGTYSETEKLKILTERYNKIISIAESLL